MSKKETIPAKKFTKYERARIIGSRALQIAQGAPLLTELSEKELEDLHYDPIAIAKKEFAAGLVPIDVQRKLPLRMADQDISRGGLSVDIAEQTSDVADEG